MSTNPMIEKWNVIDSAEMAVSVDAALYRLLNDKKRPFDFDEAIERGIAFLEEAREGGAILCGSPETSDFTGTLSPMRWSTDVYLTIDAGKEEMELYNDVVSTLASYKELLQKIKNEEKLDVDSDSNLAVEARQFFRTLATVLMEQADPLTETYSHQVAV